MINTLFLNRSEWDSDHCNWMSIEKNGVGCSNGMVVTGTKDEC